MISEIRVLKWPDVGDCMIYDMPLPPESPTTAKAVGLGNCVAVGRA